jgi:hypothetical protein
MPQSARESEDRACVRIMMGKIDQRIDLVAQPPISVVNSGISRVRLRAGNVR